MADALGDALTQPLEDALADRRREALGHGALDEPLAHLVTDPLGDHRPGLSRHAAHVRRDARAELLAEPLTELLVQLLTEARLHVLAHFFDHALDVHPSVSA